MSINYKFEDQRYKLNFKVFVLIWDRSCDLRHEVIEIISLKRSIAK